MRDRPFVPSILAVMLATFAASTALGQYVEVPTFTIGTAATDFSIVTSGVAPADDGSFVAVWEEYLTTDHTAPLLRAVVNRRATPLGTSGPLSRWERSINLMIQPTITAVPGGYFDSWIRYDHGGALLGLRVDESGAQIGHEFEISDNRDAQWLGRESAAAGIALGAVFFWYETAPAVQHVVARLYDLGGTPRGPSFEVGGTPSEPYMDAVRLGDGGFMLGWGGTSSDVYAFGRSYYPNGQPRGETFVFSSDTPFRRLAVSSDGATVAMVGVRGPGLSGPHEIWARRHGIDGTPLGNEFLVHATGPGIAVMPDVEFDLAGNLYVVWTESSVGSRARGFDANDVPLGPPVAISNEGAWEVRTARLTDGRFVNVWNSYDQPVVHANIASLCTPGTSICGDGVLQSQCELCDDGAANDDVTPDACRSTCRPAGCGDGIIDSGETCDDGNRESCDGCSATCAVETGLGCGDGVPFAACAELCDDGNATVGDGCSPSCTLERVPGGGSSTTDCYTEWSVDNAANDPLLDDGMFRRLQSCTDGDPRCDFDAVVGTCTFRLKTCANNTNVAGCTAGSRLASWELRQPSASQAAKRPVVAAARAALTGAVPSSIVGPAARDVCSPTIEVPVALRGVPGTYHAGKLSLKTLATQYDGSHDTDTMKLICLPAAP